MIWAGVCFFLFMASSPLVAGAEGSHCTLISGLIVRGQDTFMGIADIL